MTAAPKSAPLLKLHCRESRARRATPIYGEADVHREVTDHSNGGTRWGKGPSDCARIVEITPGRSIWQQGLAATCKDFLTEATTVGGKRHLDLRMSQYEQRWWGNARLCGLEAVAHGVMPQGCEGALGKWRASYGDIVQTLSWANDDKRQRGRAEGITVGGRGVRERALEPHCLWEGPSGIAAAANRTREIRPSGMRGGPGETWPESGRWALGSVDIAGDRASRSLKMRAPQFYPTGSFFLDVNQRYR